MAFRRPGGRGSSSSGSGSGTSTPSGGQTLNGAQIKALYEGESDTNAFSDSEKSKLAGIEDSATADQTGAEIKNLYEGQSDTNAFTDSEKSKLAGIEDSATADQTGQEIKNLYEAESDTNAFTDSEKTKLAGIEDSATADQTGAEIASALDTEIGSSDWRTGGTGGGNGTPFKITVIGGALNFPDERAPAATLYTFTSDPMAFTAIRFILRSGTSMHVTSTDELYIEDLTALTAVADDAINAGDNLGTVPASDTTRAASFGRAESTGSLNLLITKTNNPLEWWVGTSGGAVNTGGYSIVSAQGITFGGARGERGLQGPPGQTLTGAQIKTLYEGEANTNVFTNTEKLKLLQIENHATADQSGPEIKNLYEGQSNTNAFTDSEKTKLAQIEHNATADQTGAEIKNLYEGQSDTNAFTDREKSKLAGIEDSATADQTGAEIKNLYEGQSDTNAFTDREKSKLAGIEDSATADQTGAEIASALDTEIGNSDWRTGGTGGEGINLETLDEEDEPTYLLGGVDTQVPATYATGVTRTPALTANSESSTTMRLAIADAGGFGAATVGGGVLIFKKTKSNSNAAQPNEFRIVYLGLNNSGQHLLVQTDQADSFTATLTLLFTSGGRLVVHAKQLTFDALNAVVQFAGAQTRFSAQTAATDDFATPFRGTTPIGVQVSAVGYEVETAPASTTRAIVRAPFREIPETPTLPDVIEVVDALPLDSEGDKLWVFLRRDWISTDIAARVHFIENSDNLYYSESAIPFDVAGQRLGTKVFDDSDRIYGVRIDLSNRVFYFAVEEGSATIGSGEDPIIGFQLNGVSRFFSNRATLTELGQITANGKTYLIRSATFGADFILPTTTLGEHTYKLNFVYRNGDTLFSEGVTRKAGLYRHRGNFWEREEDEEDIKKVRRLPSTGEQSVVYLLETYTTGHAGLDFNVHAYSTAIRQMAYYDGHFYLLDQNLHRIVVINATTHARESTLEIDLGALGSNSASGIHVTAAHIMSIDSSNKRVLAFNRATRARDMAEEAKWNLSGQSLPIGVEDVGVESIAGHTLVGDFRNNKLYAYRSSSGTRNASADWNNLGTPALSIVDISLAKNVPVSYRHTAGVRELIEFNPRLEEVSFPPNGDGEYNLFSDVLYILDNVNNKAHAFLLDQTKLRGEYDITLPSSPGLNAAGITADDTNIYVTNDFDSRFYVFNKKTRAHVGNTLQTVLRGYYEWKNGAWIHEDVPAAGTAQAQAVDATAIAAAYEGLPNKNPYTDAEKTKLAGAGFKLGALIGETTITGAGTFEAGNNNIDLRGHEYVAMVGDAWPSNPDGLTNIVVLKVSAIMRNPVLEGATFSLSTHVRVQIGNPPSIDGLMAPIGLAWDAVNNRLLVRAQSSTIAPSPLRVFEITV